MKASDYALETIRDTLYWIADMGRVRQGRAVVVAYVYLSKEQLRHLFVADLMVDEFVSFRKEAGLEPRPMDEERALLKRIYELGKAPGSEVDELAEDGKTLTKTTVYEAEIDGEEFALILRVARMVEAKVIIADGEKIVAAVKVKERAAKAKAARADKAKKAEEDDSGSQ